MALTEQQVGELVKRIQSPTRDVPAKRALAVLLFNMGLDFSATGRVVGLRADYVKKWVRRYDDRGIDGLVDRPRSGRPVRYGPAVQRVILGLANRSPREFGVASDAWSAMTLRAVAIQNALVDEIGLSTVYRIVRDSRAALHPA